MLSKTTADLSAVATDTSRLFAFCLVPSTHLVYIYYDKALDVARQEVLLILQ